jgi:hypothetical protein
VRRLPVRLPIKPLLLLALVAGAVGGLQYFGLLPGIGHGAPPKIEVAAPGQPGWIVDPTNGCWIWTVNPQPGLTVSWSGACVRGPASGLGTAEWRWQENDQPQVERYVGTFQDGREDGSGVYTWASGDIYDGEWKAGRKHGRGNQIWVNGERYVGEWQNDRQYGRGTYFWKNGSTYEGEWANDRPHGFGEGYDPATGWWRGTWRDGCLSRGDDLVWAIGKSPSGCL